ncbi:hypothetical protein D3C79_794310 [compost metagenome]
MITVLIPPRCAASSFSFNPPMASTWPRRVISPVMATSARTGICVSADTSAVHMPIPALGPSFGVAPSGMWICTSCFSWKSAAIPRLRARLRTTVCAAVIDSTMTSPSEPVLISWPLPGMTTASMVSSSPPTWVQARPVTWPIWSCCSARP